MKLYLTRDFFLFVLVVSPQAVTVISVPFNECILLCRWIQTHTASTMLRRVFETEQITMKNCRTKTVFFPDTQRFFPDTQLTKSNKQQAFAEKYSLNCFSLQALSSKTESE